MVLDGQVESAPNIHEKISGSGQISGNYTVTPSLAEYTFAPSSRSVTLGPSQSGVDFTATRISYTVSGTVRELMAGSDIKFEDHGIHELKGAAAQQHLFSVRPVEEEAAVPAPAILTEPEDTPHGRQCRIEDPEGHRWMLGERAS